MLPLVHVLIETLYGRPDAKPKWQPLTSCYIPQSLTPNVYDFVMRKERETQSFVPTRITISNDASPDEICDTVEELEEYLSASW